MAARATSRGGSLAAGHGGGDAPAVDLRPLPAAFFARPTLEVARGLLGRLLVRRLPGGGLLGGWIVEVEAYIGEEDPACHAASGRSERNAVMYGPPGRAYVYFTYGMHHCVNVVTGGAGSPEAVLIRALEPALGQGLMRRRRGPGLAERDLARGPGRLCKALGIDLSLNGVPLRASPGGAGRPLPAPSGRPGPGPGKPAPAVRPRGGLFLARGRGTPAILGVSARVGIRVGAERPWRFFDAESPCVSVVRAIPRGRGAGGRGVNR